MRLHPIHYCLILNILTLAGAVGLAFAFSQPLVFIVAILLSNHAMQRFEQDREEGEIDEVVREYEGGGAGFSADLSKR
ncbi:hypothetical protein GFK26_18405 [Variovorax paradoxus]|uniref:Uncharacterized protein n=1 Tax=Variovorax paradoxus TaxID=34073 RepID=A0A5Q0M4P9_VARPD|nr:hypothetical protein [Variovorax paradoxus]QFZ84601.1 hypothetical protein GFK26_18405 [Variovorax paradoxus]